MKDIFSYNEIVSKEGFNIQRGMNFRPQNKRYSILLMSVRENAPYNDGFDDKGQKLIYEGEDVSRRENKNPKDFDQPFFTKTGKITNNGLFFKAAEDYKYKRKEKPELVKVYEKINNNIWTDKGWFSLVDAEYNISNIEKRKVFKFILLPEGSKIEMTKEEIEEFEFSRRIPTEVKRIVWERDGGKCAKSGCGSTKDLHFDHIIPWSKGGSSRDPKNIQILCGKHNLNKSDKIQ
jgi:hypothetical protein